MKFTLQGNDIEGLSFPMAVLRVLIYDHNTGNFEQVSEDAKAFGSNGIADFFIQEIFADNRR